jgi:uncharacterized protein YndB with AHSA1/START domain
MMLVVNYVEDRIIIDADATTVYAMVTDIARMGDWSPENVGGRWLGAATLEMGARFRGDNRRGLRGPNPNGALRWHTVCTVTEVDPRHRFAFTVAFLGREVAEWCYSFEETGGMCTVTERWTDRRSEPDRHIDDAYVRFALRMKDRGQWNLQNIRTTLANLKEKAEAPKS